MNSELPLIDPATFKSQKIAVILKNFTAHQDSKAHFELLEMQNQAVTLDVPSEFCTQGHNILIGISIPEHPHFIATSKVISVEPLGLDHARVQVDLVQYDKKSWTSIQAAFAARQTRVSRLLAEAKGY